MHELCKFDELWQNLMNYNQLKMNPIELSIDLFFKVYLPKNLFWAEIIIRALYYLFVSYAIIISIIIIIHFNNYHYFFNNMIGVTYDAIVSQIRNAYFLYNKRQTFHHHYV
ncbi:hypothetical protein GLOIN_2v1645578 [Rhizophagus irregularis DAOM 181602=DAOM 197198]|uniref:Uncharacterized protein n=1 Tax=Rhizophagus irregularis (strain DAOM 181602 / DAOM 197198 / MUCL 43194) TaxID=747089 RepID=A0A2P4PQC6_RHIID|nr:hypothetical protein GLOIN_2v1645578 [Rhizophagus irregularis DAOM 181602=DAOM 197198]POG67598.1 hypothetical protein GLOIN_2v1645578 [Rhizophagus irregularis DAOM 181602=DAOM 197198]GET63706.1 hypothetical protein GLOIN_2v1645578 [Rhizophagus irregularis DAOM 181602=DAOM 197198]|eukprot:XP_025174464.1 hypothetical protein GLOIN_2v1645578 [Rhizophagus irregularis DAOM 181602=DAOM 197198]